MHVPNSSKTGEGEQKFFLSILRVLRVLLFKVRDGASGWIANRVTARQSRPRSCGLQLLIKKQVANSLACSVRMVERLVAWGTLKAVEIRGAVRFRSSDIEQILMKAALLRAIRG
jgi:excisionase family DNA binding protein